MNFEENIKQWINIDNQLHELNNNIKQLRQEKNKTEERIFQYVETNKLTNSTVKISDGKLKFVSMKQAQPLTFKYVEDCLNKCIKNPEQVKLILNYIKDSRDCKYTPDIKRFYA
jgi:hypothetical protein